MRFVWLLLLLWLTALAFSIPCSSSTTTGVGMRDEECAATLRNTRDAANLNFSATQDWQEDGNNHHRAVHVNDEVIMDNSARVVIKEGEENSLYRVTLRDGAWIDVHGVLNLATDDGTDGCGNGLDVSETVQVTFDIEDIPTHRNIDTLVKALPGELASDSSVAGVEAENFFVANVDDSDEPVYTVEIVTGAATELLGHALRDSAYDHGAANVVYKAAQPHGWTISSPVGQSFLGLVFETDDVATFVASLADNIATDVTGVNANDLTVILESNYSQSPSGYEVFVRAAADVIASISTLERLPSVTEAALSDVYYGDRTNLATFWVTLDPARAGKSSVASLLAVLPELLADQLVNELAITVLVEADDFWSTGQIDPDNHNRVELQTKLQSLIEELRYLIGSYFLAGIGIVPGIDDALVGPVIDFCNYNRIELSVILKDSQFATMEELVHGFPLIHEEFNATTSCGIDSETQSNGDIALLFLRFAQRDKFHRVLTTLKGRSMLPEAHVRKQLGESFTVRATLPEERSARDSDAVCLQLRVEGEIGKVGQKTTQPLSTLLDIAMEFSSLVSENAHGLKASNAISDASLSDDVVLVSYDLLDSSKPLRATGAVFEFLLFDSFHVGGVEQWNSQRRSVNESFPLSSAVSLSLCKLGFKLTVGPDAVLSNVIPDLAALAGVSGRDMRLVGVYDKAASENKRWKGLKLLIESVNNDPMLIGQVVLAFVTAGATNGGSVVLGGAEADMELDVGDATVTELILSLPPGVTCDELAIQRLLLEFLILFHSDLSQQTSLEEDKDYTVEALFVDPTQCVLRLLLSTPTSDADRDLGEVAVGTSLGGSEVRGVVEDVNPSLRAYYYPNEPDTMPLAVPMLGGAIVLLFLCIVFFVVLRKWRRGRSHAMGGMASIEMDKIRPKLQTAPSATRSNKDGFSKLDV